MFRNSVIPNADPLATGLGFVSWNTNIMQVAGGTSPTGGTIYATALYIPPGKVITGIVIPIIVPAAGTKPTGFFVGLCSPTKMLAQSGDVSGAAGVPFATSSLNQIAFSSAYTSSINDSSLGIYYVLILQVGTWGTTQPQFGRAGSQPGGSERLTGKNPIQATLATGQTALPANNTTITLTDSPNQYLMGVY